MFKKWFLLSALLSVVFAGSPITMLEDVSQNLLKQLEQNKSQIEHNQTAVEHIIDTVLLPVVDTEYMSKMVVGPVYWRASTQEQKQVFIHEFVNMVTANYARLFAAYSDQKITFIPLRVDPNTMRMVEVRSLVTASSKDSFKVYYKLIKQDANTWRVYDFSIDGISMIESYKSQFAPVLAEQGMAGLIASMKAHNKKSVS